VVRLGARAKRDHPCEYRKVIPPPSASCSGGAGPSLPGPRTPGGGCAEGLLLHEDCLRPRAALGIRPSRCPSSGCRQPHSSGSAERAAVSHRPCPGAHGIPEGAPGAAGGSADRPCQCTWISRRKIARAACNSQKTELGGRFPAEARIPVDARRDIAGGVQLVIAMGHALHCSGGVQPLPVIIAMAPSAEHKACRRRAGLIPACGRHPNRNSLPIPTGTHFRCHGKGIPTRGASQMAAMPVAPSRVHPRMRGRVFVVAYTLDNVQGSSISREPHPRGVRSINCSVRK
jgi:hypothetical protein